VQLNKSIKGNVMRKYLLPLVAVATLASAASAFAATSSGTFNVQVTIVKACTVGATAVNFGNLSTILGTEAGTSTVSVTCNAGTPYSLSFVSGSASLTATGSLVNGANSIPVAYSFANAAAAAGTGTATNTMDVKLPTATPYPATGLYQQTQTVYVNY
jgi:spore coat protein U-like protein